jgi:uncharacterized membrane protein YphA (DoxX/SURF4 family)
MLLDLFTRPTAFILSGDMAFAYFWAHAPKSFYPALNGGMAGDPVLLCLPLYLLRGPGAVESRSQTPPKHDLRRADQPFPLVSASPRLSLR